MGSVWRTRDDRRIDSATGLGARRVVAVQPSHVVVVVVNAEVHPPPGFRLSAAAPSIATMLGAVSGTQTYSYNFETLELMREPGAVADA
jgi:hypothetical protein